MRPFSRREILLSLVASVATKSRAAATKNIAIVGAGISGLAAAVHLAKAGMTVTIFEARSRVGGRIFTDRSLGFPIEIGANWIHGDRRNPLTKLAKESGIKATPFDFDDWRIIASDGETISSSSQNSWEALSESLAATIEDAGTERNLGKSLKSILDTKLPSSPLSEAQSQIMHALLHREISGDFGADSDEVAAAVDYLSDGYEGEDLLVTNGYDKLITLFSQNLDVRLQEPVSSIEVASDAATIVTKTGRHTFDAVVVSVPLGTLKAKTIKFDPPLSQHRSDIIDRTGFGAFEKAFLTVDKPFDFAALNVSIVGDTPWANLIDISDVAGRPAILAYCGGDDARKTATATDDENRDWLLAALRAAANDKSLMPVNFVMSRWQSDEWSNGSYSFASTESLPDDSENLGGREGNKLYFAGEACSRYWGTVHGALQSGFQAAKLVMQD